MSSLLRARNNSFLEKQAGRGTRVLGFITNAFGKAPANAMRAIGRSMKGFTGQYSKNGKIINGTVKGDSFADTIYNWGQGILNKNQELLKATGGKGYNSWLTNGVRAATGSAVGGGLLYGGYKTVKNKIENTVANHAYDASIQTANQLLTALANRPWYERVYNVFSPSGYSQQALQQAIPMITDTFVKQMEGLGHKGWKPESLLKQ